MGGNESGRALMQGSSKRSTNWTYHLVNLLANHLANYFANTKGIELILKLIHQ